MGKSVSKGLCQHSGGHPAVSSPASGDLFVEFDPDNDDAHTNGKFNIKRHNGSASLQVQGSSPLGNTDVSPHSGSISLVLNLNQGSNVNVTFTTETDNGKASVDDMVLDINSALSSAGARDVTAPNVSGKLTIIDSKVEISE